MKSAIITCNWTFLLDSLLPDNDMETFIGYESLVDSLGLFLSSSNNLNKPISSNLLFYVAWLPLLSTAHPVSSFSWHLHLFPSKCPLRLENLSSYWPFIQLCIKLNNVQKDYSSQSTERLFHNNTLRR